MTKSAFLSPVCITYVILISIIKFTLDLWGIGAKGTLQALQILIHFVFRKDLDFISSKYVTLYVGEEIEVQDNDSTFMATMW